jgi:uncharacterized protein (TIGR02453 family)
VRADGYFSAELFRFLAELRTHNNREWFQKNKERYEAQVRDPLLGFIADLGSGLRKINSHIVADPSPTRGSMMRIYRDIRFSKHKSPYKTSVAAHFWHDKGNEGATPGYYLRLEPSGSLVGAGIWRPEPGALGKIRDAIVSDSKRWKRATSTGQRGAHYEMWGESLQRVPRGYDPDHPFAEDLKRKDFTVGSSCRTRRFCGTTSGSRHSPHFEKWRRSSSFSRKRSVCRNIADLRGAVLRARERPQ